LRSYEGNYAYYLDNIAEEKELARTAAALREKAAKENEKKAQQREKEKAKKKG